MEKSRREFLKMAVAGSAALLAGRLKVLRADSPASKPQDKPQAKSRNSLPRWRGFNLTQMFTMHSRGNFREQDFQWISDFGFDFVRLPLCYRLWIEDGDDYKINQAMLEKLDTAVDFGQKYGIHVCLNLHRAPGYSVNAEFKEPFSLWKDKPAIDAFCFQWQMLAKRYKGIPTDKISFNLVNEPPDAGNQKVMSRSDYERVMRAGTAAIREVSPQRIIIVDGLNWAREPLPELADLGVAQSCRAYDPMSLSHYKANWVNTGDAPEPAWPTRDGWDRAKLEDRAKPWFELMKKGIGVHCGEGGAYRYTPHKVVLAWLGDVCDILRSHDIGLALWSFRGDFGILDSHREDVAYEDFHGHKLDRELLTLLQKQA
jgi:endoglucanase